MNWEQYLRRLIISYREDFQRLSQQIQEEIRNEDFDNTLLSPCQIEVLDTPWEGSVVWLIVHDEELPDMTFRIHKNTEKVDTSEFIKKYQFFSKDQVARYYESPLYRELDHISVLWKTKVRYWLYRDTQPEAIASAILRSSLKHIEDKTRNEQYLTISRNFERLREEIGKTTEKLPEKLSSYVLKIEKGLNEIKRLDKEIIRVEKKIDTHTQTRNSDAHAQKIFNFINSFYGDSFFPQMATEGNNIEIGDEFENISESIIATRRSRAIDIRTQLSDAFQQAHSLILTKTDLKESLRNQVKETLDSLEEELRKEELDLGKIQRLWKWLKKNANWVVPTLTQVVIETLKRALL